MFEEDNEGYGINSFNSAIEDPQASNSINTSLIELLIEVKKVADKNSAELTLVNKLLSRSFSSDKILDMQTLLKNMTLSSTFKH